MLTVYRGAIIFTPVFEQLVPRIGFGWTTRTMGLLLLAALVLPVATMAKKTPRSPRRAIIDASALREPAFLLVLASMLIIFAGMYVPYFYIVVFSVRAKILVGGDAYLNKYLIVFLNTGSFVGRLVRLNHLIASLLSLLTILTSYPTF